MAIAEIHVTLKPALLDTQGATVAKALHQLGYEAVQDVRIGKFITVHVDDAQAGPALQRQLTEMCQKLLANPVIEDYEITVTSAPSALVEPAVAAVPSAPMDAGLGTTVLPSSPVEVGSARGPMVAEIGAGSTLDATPRSVLSPSEQLASGQISRSETATPDPFAMDYAQFDAMAAPDKLAMQDLAWRKHGSWILQQLSTRRAQWILCAGGEVIDSGDSLDTFPSDTRRAEVGTERGLVPWVFVRPPA
ncbi:MAG: phosphoribosylformylglycinamidine synthase subunit PurS [Abditibacteriota bacterium]|nr:phosphoribosylformylglycinamidine synthase subunit PurS [Abditibacteriota bacterium]